MTPIFSNSIIGEIGRIYEDRRTGVLVLGNEGGERVQVSFLEGEIQSASSNLKARRLGDYLARTQHILARDLDAVQPEAQRNKMRLGEALVRRKLLDQIQVGAAVRSQAIELLDYAFRSSFSVESFTPLLLGSYYAPARITFTQLL